MENFEILKKHLNTEKVFYDFNCHELVLDKSFDHSLNEHFESDNISEEGKFVCADQDNDGKNEHSNINLREKNKQSERKAKWGDIFGRSNEQENPTMNRKMKKGKGGGGSIKIGNTSKERRSLSVSSNQKYEQENQKENSNNRSNNTNRNRGNTPNLKNHKEEGTETEAIPSTPIQLCMSKNGCINKRKEKIKKCDFIEEIKLQESSSEMHFIPPVDILYDNEKVIFFFFISGDLQNFNISTSNNYVTISGKKIPYDTHKCANYYSHEIKAGDFVRTYYFMKSIEQEKIRYEHKNGVVKIFIYLSGGAKS
ncbi:hypothetical protein, conserved [Plasmodium gonderi]|uniref:SHSP domain-containing protein n=1 Tax=Plasmodium gonderi TaxID=77519 RepID=A0A1Y1JNB1_PLAGO|nr:hypothetical protein, conserved [Plasmodium gonderi]GAW83740.1 hypothetical protein, conserved [Plasmodium gonderi]